MSRAAHALTNLLYPPACLVCHAGLPRGSTGATPALCERCHGELARCGPPVCVHCGAAVPGAFDATAVCGPCRSAPRAFEQARAPWHYRGAVREAIRQFKYHRRWRLGRWLAEEMARTARASFPLEEISAVLPVPLHRLKRLLRGFSPAESLAWTVARAVKKPCLPHALRQPRWTRSQTRLGTRERARNVREAFVAHGRTVRNRTVLLVDDVLTSGSTADACATALKTAGAVRVFVLTAARTPLGNRFT